MEWREDTTMFNASLRSSGNSIVLTIPKPIVRRFMLRPGQRVAVVGMRRESPVFQGMIGVYLGTFKVVEPTYGFELLIENPPPLFFNGEALKLEPLSDLAARHGCKLSQQVDGQLLRIRGILSNLDSPSMEPIAEDDVERLARELVNKLSRMGLKVVGAKTFRVELEHSIDPAMIARTKLKDIDGLRCEWVL